MMVYVNYIKAGLFCICRGPALSPSMCLCRTAYDRSNHNPRNLSCSLFMLMTDTEKVSSEKGAIICPPFGAHPHDGKELLE